MCNNRVCISLDAFFRYLESFNVPGTVKRKCGSSSGTTSSTSDDDKQREAVGAMEGQWYIFNWKIIVCLICIPEKWTPEQGSRFTIMFHSWSTASVEVHNLCVIVTETLVVAEGSKVIPAAPAHPLTPLALHCKAESVVSATSQCSFSSTIVHVGDKKPPESGLNLFYELFIFGQC